MIFNITGIASAGGVKRDLKSKGKLARDPPGPFSVKVLFADGSSLMVCQNVDDETSYRAYNDHSSGIGARVGTTKRVSMMDEVGHELAYWVYEGGEQI
jgi:hypothetical protein